VGTSGTAAVFFAGCPMGCVFCQNYQLSHLGVGRPATVEGVASELLSLCSAGAQTISFVCPDHFAPHAGAIAGLLRRSGMEHPMVVNCSGYQSIPTLRLMESFVDVYLPDFKYAIGTLSAAVADCSDYPAVALDAIAEMLRQKGLLRMGPDGIAVRGVLVRHLVLPGEVENSVRALRMLAAEFGPELPLSLMSQYAPRGPDLPRELCRGLLPEEFARVYREARELGFALMYVQPTRWSASRPRLPDFSLAQPFPTTLWH
jgi:putative pyruvate formate lyase activating enzyme